MITILNGLTFITICIHTLHVFIYLTFQHNSFNLQSHIHTSWILLHVLVITFSNAQESSSQLNFILAKVHFKHFVFRYYILQLHVHTHIQAKQDLQEEMRMELEKVGIKKCLLFFTNNYFRLL